MQWNVFTKLLSTNLCDESNTYVEHMHKIIYVHLSKYYINSAQIILEILKINSAGLSQMLGIVYT